MKTFKQLVIGNLIGIALVLIVATIATTAHCAVGNKKYQGNALGFVQYETNPIVYKEGKLTNVAYLDKGMVIRIQPRGTYSLYTEDILLCGQPVELFSNKMNPLVVSYEAVSHRAIEGIGCHELRFVDEVKENKDVLQMP